MKKILIFATVLIAALSITAIVFATANSQTEGKVMNAEKQILTDGDMEASDTSAWTALNSATLTKQNDAAEDGGRILRVAYNTKSYPAASQQDVLTIGKRYRVTGWARCDGSGALPKVSDDAQVWNGTASTDWQRVNTVFPGLGTRIYFQTWTTSAGYCEWDDIVVTEYTGETTNAEKQILADGDMEKSGTGDWTANPYATLSKEFDAAEDGNQIIRLTNLSGSVHNMTIQQQTLDETKIYHITGWARSDGTALPEIAFGSAFTSHWKGSASTEWQRIEYVGMPVGGTKTVYLGSLNAPNNSYVEYDDITVTEYTPETTSAQKQLVTDGDMEASGTGGWTSSDSVLSKEDGAAEDGSQILRVTRTASTYWAIQTGILTIGKRYRITGWARSSGDDNPAISIVASPYTWQGTTSTEWQRVDITAVAGFGTIYLGSGGDTPGGYIEFDDITVTEL